MFLLGLGVKVLLVAAAVGAVAAVVVYVAGCITKAKLKAKLEEENIQKAIITSIDNCNNVVKLKNLNGDKELEIRGDDIDDSLTENEKIYV